MVLLVVEDDGNVAKQVVNEHFKHALLKSCLWFFLSQIISTMFVFVLPIVKQNNLQGFTLYLVWVAIPNSIYEAVFISQTCIKFWPKDDKEASELKDCLARRRTAAATTTTASVKAAVTGLALLVVTSTSLVFLTAVGLDKTKFWVSYGTIMFYMLYCLSLELSGLLSGFKAGYLRYGIGAAHLFALFCYRQMDTSTIFAVLGLSLFSILLLFIEIHQRKANHDLIHSFLQGTSSSSSSQLESSIP